LIPKLIGGEHTMIHPTIHESDSENPVRKLHEVAIVDSDGGEGKDVV
jgi:hypothetical protein